GLTKLVLRAPADDVDTVAEELLQHLLERERSRPTIHQGEQDNADGPLERRKLVQLIEDEDRVGIALEIDDQPHGLTDARARFVADIAHSLDALRFYQLTDGFVQSVARH